MLETNYELFSACGDVAIDTKRLINKGLSVHGWPSGHALDCEEALKFAQLHGIRGMIEKFPFAEAPKAFESMKNGKVGFKAILVMD